jgi:hypothetical protein
MSSKTTRLVCIHFSPSQMLPSALVIIWEFCIWVSPLPILFLQPHLPSRIRLPGLFLSKNNSGIMNFVDGRTPWTG